MGKFLSELTAKPLLFPNLVPRISRLPAGKDDLEHDYRRQVQNTQPEPQGKNATATDPASLAASENYCGAQRRLRQHVSGGFVA